MKVDFPELPAEAIVLMPDSRTRGPRSEDPAWSERLAAKLRIGGPVGVPVTREYVASSPDLVAFVAGEAGRHVYHLVHLAVGFEPDSQLPPLESVNVQLKLSAGSGAPPVAWSMLPACVADTEEATTDVRLSPQLKFFGVEATVGSAGRSSSRDRRRIFLEAFGELQDDPKWEFHRTRSRELRGSYRLVLVARCPVGRPSTVEVSVHAEAVSGSILRRYRYAASPTVISARL